LIIREKKGRIVHTTDAVVIMVQKIQRGWWHKASSEI